MVFGGALQKEVDRLRARDPDLVDTLLTQLQRHGALEDYPRWTLDFDWLLDTAKLTIESAEEACTYREQYRQCMLLAIRRALSAQDMALLHDHTERSALALKVAGEANWLRLNHDPGYPTPELRFDPQAVEEHVYPPPPAEVPESIAAINFGGAPFRIPGGFRFLPHTEPQRKHRRPRRPPIRPMPPPGRLGPSPPQDNVFKRAFKRLWPMREDKGA